MMTGCSCATCSTQLHKPTNDKLQIWSGLKNSGKNSLLTLIMEQMNVTYILFTSIGLSSYNVKKKFPSGISLVILMKDNITTVDHIVQTYQQTAERDIKFIFLTEKVISEEQRQQYQDVLEVVDFHPPIHI